MSDSTAKDIQDTTQPVPEGALDVDELDTVAGGVSREVVREHTLAREHHI